MIIKVSIRLVIRSYYPLTYTYTNEMIFLSMETNCLYARSGITNLRRLCSNSLGLHLIAYRHIKNYIYYRVSVHLVLDSLFTVNFTFFNIISKKCVV